MPAVSLTRGVYAYDFGDTAGMTPMVKMLTLGHNFVPSGFHAGGQMYRFSLPDTASGAGVAVVMRAPPNGA